MSHQERWPVEGNECPGAVRLAGFSPTRAAPDLAKRQDDNQTGA
jgi:hypothetical protein